MSTQNIFKLPADGEVSLSYDVIVDGADLQRFINAGGTIYKRGFRLDVNEGAGLVSFIAYPKRESLLATKDAWCKGGDYFLKLAHARENEGPGVMLACLVLADYCTHRYLEDHGGPTLNMIMLAESVVSHSINQVIAALSQEPAS